MNRCAFDTLRHRRRGAGRCDRSSLFWPHWERILLYRFQRWDRNWVAHSSGSPWFGHPLPWKGLLKIKMARRIASLANGSTAEAENGSERVEKLGLNRGGERKISIFCRRVIGIYAAAAPASSKIESYVFDWIRKKIHQRTNIFLRQ